MNTQEGRLPTAIKPDLVFYLTGILAQLPAAFLLDSEPNHSLHYLSLFFYLYALITTCLDIPTETAEETETEGECFLVFKVFSFG